jgi:hypothetical protein
MAMKTMSDISMLTYLIQASATVLNRNGDTSLHSYVETQDMTSRTKLDLAKEANFASLDSLCDILVQDPHILAASYDDATRFTLVMPESESEMVPDDLGNPDAIDMEFPPPPAVVSTNTFMPMNAAVIPNPNDRRDLLSRGPGLQDGKKSCRLNMDLIQMIVN